MRLYCSGPTTNRGDGISASIFEVIESDTTFEKQENDEVLRFSKGIKELHTVKSETKKGNDFYSPLSQKPSVILAFPRRIDLISVPVKTIPAV
jgi:hypothetical protein